MTSSNDTMRHRYVFVSYHQEDDQNEDSRKGRVRQFAADVQTELQAYVGTAPSRTRHETIGEKSMFPNPPEGEKRALLTFR